MYPGDQLLNKRIEDLVESKDRIQSMDQSSLSSYQNIESSSQDKNDTAMFQEHDTNEQVKER